jgi:hypothetical protein
VTITIIVAIKLTRSEKKHVDEAFEEDVGAALVLVVGTAVAAGGEPPDGLAVLLTGALLVPEVGGAEVGVLDETQFDRYMASMASANHPASGTDQPVVKDGNTAVLIVLYD